VSGLGDLSCGFKIANYLHTQLGIPKQCIFYATNAPSAAALFNDYAFAVIDCSIGSKEQLKEMSKTIQFDIQIVVPTTDPYKATEFLAINKIPTLIFYEYGLDNTNNHFSNAVLSFSFGLNKQKNQIGILIDQELYQWSTTVQDRFHQLQQLKTVHSSIQTAILDVGDFDKQCKYFSEQALLYAIYVSQLKTAEAFIHAIIDFNQDNDKNIFITVPLLKLEPFIEKFTNVASITIKTWDPQRPLIEKTIEKNKKLKKTLTLIGGCFTYQDLKTLLMASEKETILTGDQSISEGISANKSFVYETLLHKQLFVDDLNQIYSQYLGYNVATSKKEEILHIFINNKKNNYANLSKVNQFICNESNAFSIIADIIKKRWVTM
jgi:hypothetical protein